MPIREVTVLVGILVVYVIVCGAVSVGTGRIVRSAVLLEHASTSTRKLDEHHLQMAKLLGVTDQVTADAPNATPGHRQLDTSGV